MRRTILITAGALLLIMIGGAAYFFLSPRAAAPGQTQNSFFSWLPIIGARQGTAPAAGVTETPPAGTPLPGGTQAARQLYQVTDEPVVSAAFDPTGKELLYYKQADGHLASNAFSGGNEQTISPLTILNMLSAQWSPDRTRAIITYQDGGTIKRFVTETTTTPAVSFLPADAAAPAWAPDGKSLWWLGQQSGVSTLISAGKDAKNQKRAGFSTPIPDLTIAPLSSRLIGLIPKTVSFFDTPYVLFDTVTRSQHTLVRGFGLTAIENQNAKNPMVAYTPATATGAPGSLHVWEITNGNNIEFPIKTLAEKCVFSRDTTLLFCAVPDTMPSSDLPEAWFQGKISFSDSFFRFNLATGKTDEIYKSSGLDATKLIVSDDAGYLFFVDKKSGVLYGLAVQ